MMRVCQSWLRVLIYSALLWLNGSDCFATTLDTPRVICHAMKKSFDSVLSVNSPGTIIVQSTEFGSCQLVATDELLLNRPVELDYASAAKISMGLLSKDKMVPLVPALTLQFEGVPLIDEPGGMDLKLATKAVDFVDRVRLSSAPGFEYPFLVVLTGGKQLPPGIVLDTGNLPPTQSGCYIDGGLVVKKAGSPENYFQYQNSIPVGGADSFCTCAGQNECELIINELPGDKGQGNHQRVSGSGGQTSSLVEGSGESAGATGGAIGGSSSSGGGGGDRRGNGGFQKKEPEIKMFVAEGKKEKGKMLSKPEKWKGIGGLRDALGFVGNKAFGKPDSLYELSELDRKICNHIIQTITTNTYGYREEMLDERHFQRYMTNGVIWDYIKDEIPPGYREKINQARVELSPSRHAGSGDLPEGVRSVVGSEAYKEERKESVLKALKKLDVRSKNPGGSGTK